MKRFFYFELSTTDSMLVSVDNFLGGETHTDAASIHLNFQGIEGDADESLADLVITSGKSQEGFKAICNLANSGTEPFIVIADVTNGIFCHPDITGIAALTE